MRAVPIWYMQGPLLNCSRRYAMAALHLEDSHSESSGTNPAPAEPGIRKCHPLSNHSQVVVFIG